MKIIVYMNSANGKIPAGSVTVLLNSTIFTETASNNSPI